MEEQTTPIAIDDDIEWLTEQIDALKQLGRQNEVSDSEKYDFSIRWGTALAGRLPRLVHYSSRDMLNDADEHRFRALCDEMRQLSDLIDRIGVIQPVLEPKRGQEPKPTTSPRGRLFRRS